MCSVGQNGFSPPQTDTRRFLPEPVKVAPQGELGDRLAAALPLYRVSACNRLTCRPPRAQTGLCCSLPSAEG